MVDLGSLANIQFIRILNREAAEWVQLRASPLVVEVSDDGERWTLLFQTPAGHVFSGYSGGQLLVCGADRYNPVELGSSGSALPAKSVCTSRRSKSTVCILPMPTLRVALEHTAKSSWMSVDILVKLWKK